MALSPRPKAISDYGIDPDAMIIVNMLDRVLERVVGIYEQSNVPLPSRRYWMFGPEVPEDCEQVVVTFMQSYLGIPGDQAANAQNCNSPRSAVLNVVVTRNFPIGEVGNAIEPAAIMEASKWAAIDSAVLSWGLADIAAIDGMPGPSVIATINTPSPSGGVQSTILNLTMMIA